MCVRLIEWCFFAAFNSISVISRRQLTLFVHLGFTSTRLGSEVSCPRTLPRKNPEDPVRLELRTPGLRVKHFTTEPRGTHLCLSSLLKWFPSVLLDYVRMKFVFRSDLCLNNLRSLISVRSLVKYM